MRVMTTAVLHGPPRGLPRHPILEDDQRRRRGVRWFLGLTFGVSWAAWGVAYAAGYSLANVVVQLLAGAFVPAAAAILVRRFVTREGFADAGLPLRLPGRWRYYVLAAMLPIVMLTCAAAAAAITGYWRPSADDLLDPGSLLFLATAPLVVVVTAPVYWGEEFGWTAYLRMRLCPGRPYASTLLTGVIWGVWHWPLTFIGYFDGSVVGGPTDVALALLLWVVVAVLLELVLSWVFWSSGTIWTTSMVHAGNNLVVSAGAGSLLGADAGVNAGFVVLGLAVVPVCAWILVRERRHPRHTHLP